MVDGTKNETGHGTISGISGDASWISCQNAGELVNFLGIRNHNPLPSFQRLRSLLLIVSRRKGTAERSKPFDEIRAAISEGRPDDQAVLTDGLQATARVRFENNRSHHRILTGVAGTGKTQILLWEATDLAKIKGAGKTLFLCWNVALQERLALACRPFNTIHVDRADNVLDQIVTHNGIILPQEKGDTYYKTLRDSIGAIQKIKLPRPLRNVCRILIDEAQDLAAPHWTAIKAIQADKNASLLVSSDPHQKWANHEGTSLTELQNNFCDKTWHEFRLLRNMRNPQEIKREVRKWLAAISDESTAAASMPDIIDNIWPGITTVKNISRDQILSELETLLAELRQIHHDHAIMILVSDTHHWLVNKSGTAGITPINEIRTRFPFIQIGRIPPPGEFAIGLDTIYRAKGLEAEAVIAFIEQRPPQDPMRANQEKLRKFRRAYIAGSRARERLHLRWVG
ncbi:MAG: hypothetical protein EBU49_11690 [Proteobacteria bacterium]|nr:hypothetical protein [Pseudomonadota bacterium]